MLQPLTSGRLLKLQVADPTVCNQGRCRTGGSNLLELEPLKEGAVGAHITDWETEMLRRAQLASERVKLPIDIACWLPGIEKLT